MWFIGPSLPQNIMSCGMRTDEESDGEDSMVLESSGGGTALAVAMAGAFCQCEVSYRIGLPCAG